MNDDDQQLGSAVIPKGEPSAVNMGRLRLDLSKNDRAALRRLMTTGLAPLGGGTHWQSR